MLKILIPSSAPMDFMDLPIWITRHGLSTPMILGMILPQEIVNLDTATMTATVVLLPSRMSTLASSPTCPLVDGLPDRENTPSWPMIKQRELHL